VHHGPSATATLPATPPIAHCPPPPTINQSTTTTTKPAKLSSHLQVQERQAKGSTPVHRASQQVKDTINATSTYSHWESHRADPDTHLQSQVRQAGAVYVRRPPSPAGTFAPGGTSCSLPQRVWKVPWAVPTHLQPTQHTHESGKLHEGCCSLNVPLASTRTGCCHLSWAAQCVCWLKQVFPSTFLSGELKAKNSLNSPVNSTIFPYFGTMTCPAPSRRVAGDVIQRTLAQPHGGIRVPLLESTFCSP